MFATATAQSFLAALAQPDTVQEDLLIRTILAPNAECEIGQRYGFGKIRSFAEYQRAVPIARYDAFEPYIERIVQGGEQGILTTEPVKRFFLTSGSTNRAKHIPVTSSFVRAKSRAFGIFWSLVFADHPSVKAGRMVTNFSDSGEAVGSPGGLPCSSESAYWASVTRATQRDASPIIPKAVAQIDDSDARYYAIARLLLAERFAAIMTLNPSTIVLLFDTIGQHAERLVADIARGGIDPSIAVGDEVRAYAAARYPADPDRARVLAGLHADGQLFAHRIWPELALAICWRSPMLRPYLALLEPHFSDRIAGRDYILMASEGVMAVPLGDGGSGGALAIGSHVYELIAEDEYDRPDPVARLPHELEVGKTYVVVLTNGAGLYRYDIGDVVRVVRFEARTPVIEFLHRAGSTCSLTGEKLTEDQVSAAMAEIAAGHAITLAGFRVAPAAVGFPRYVAVIEPAPGVDPTRLQTWPVAFDEALARQNIEYGSKRSSRRLAAPEIWVAAPGAFADERQARIAAGASDSQIKPTHLTRNADAIAGLAIVTRHHAD